MPAKPIWYYLAPALVVLDAALATANWYLRPERAVPWATALLVLACMALALLSTAESIRSGVVFAGLILVFTLSTTLADTLGAGSHADLSERATMAIGGAFLVFTGNVIPKTLTPLAGISCDAARVQAAQRFAGWTWVLTGLVIAIAWLALPRKLAETMSYILLPAAMIVVAAQLFRLRRARPSAG